MHKLISVLALGVRLLCHGTELPASPQEKQEDHVNVPEIEAALRGSIHAIRGAEWPRSRITGEPQSIAGGAKLSRFTLHLPDGRSVKTITTTIFMIQEDGRINLAGVTPQPQLSAFRHGHLLNFHQAVSEAKRIAKEFKIYDRPSIGKVLESWERENPKDESAPYLTDTLLGQRVEVSLRIKYDIIGDGWYLDTTFLDLDVYGPLSEAPVEAPKP